MVVRSPIQELSGLLWREREVLDLLLRGLRTGATDDECTGLLRSISSLELHRAITAREVALELGADGDGRLVDLIGRAPIDWQPLLADHLKALRSLADEVDDCLDSVVDLRGGAAPVRRRGVQRSLREFLT